MSAVVMAESTGAFGQQEQEQQEQQQRIITVRPREPVGFALEAGSAVTFLVEEEENRDNDDDDDDGAEWYWLMVPCRRVTQEKEEAVAEDDGDNGDDAAAGDSQRKGLSLRWTSSQGPSSSAAAADTFQNGSATTVAATTTTTGNGDLSLEWTTALDDSDDSDDGGDGDDYLNVTRPLSHRQLHVQSHRRGQSRSTVDLLTYQLVVTRGRPYMVMAVPAQSSQSSSQSSESSAATVHGVDPRSASLSFHGGTTHQVKQEPPLPVRGGDANDEAVEEEKGKSYAYLLARGNGGTSGILCRLLMLEGLGERRLSARSTPMMTAADTSPPLVPLVESSGEDAPVHVRWTLPPSADASADSSTDSSTSSAGSRQSRSSIAASSFSTHLYLSKLEPGSHYSVVALSKRGGDDALHVSRPVVFQTLQEGSTCTVASGLTFCNKVQYSVALSSGSGDIGNNQQQQRLASIDNQTAVRHAAFVAALYQYKCSDENATYFYSPIRTCSDCVQAYKDWLCARSFPRCDTAGTSGGGNLAVQELKTCDYLCYRVASSCPGFLRFDCPAEDQTASGTGTGTGTSTYGTYPQCNSMAVVPNSADRTWRPPSSGALVVAVVVTLLMASL